MAGRKDLEAGGAFVRLYLRDELTRKLVRTLRTAGQKLQNFGRAAQQMGRQIATASAAMLVPIGLATRTFANFQDEMLTVKAVTGATGDQFDLLNEKAKELGRSTSFTAAQVAGAMVSLGRAGFASDEIDASIADMLNLARATGTELPEAAEIAAASLRSFGLAANEMGRVADVMTATANNAALTLTDLGESMKLAAPIADEFGLSIEETALAIGTLANFGIKGTMAGTGLRQIMLQLSDPAIRERLEGLGVSLDSFGKTMLDIGRVSQDMTGTERLAFLKELFGQRAAGAGAKLGKEAFEKLADAIDNAAGTAAKTAEVMDSGLGGAFRRLWSAIEGTAISLGEAIAGPLGRLADIIVPIAQKTAEWITANKGLVTGMVAGVAAAGAIGIAIMGLGGVLTVAGMAVSALATAFGLIATPVGAAVAALALLAGNALFEMWKSGGFADVAADFRQMGNEIKESMGSISGAIEAGELELAFDIAAAQIKLTWHDLMETLKREFKDMLKQTAKDAVMFKANHRALAKKLGKELGKDWLGGGAGVDLRREALVRELEALRAQVPGIPDEQTATGTASSISPFDFIPGFGRPGVAGTGAGGTAAPQSPVGASGRDIYGEMRQRIHEAELAFLEPMDAAIARVNREFNDLLMQNLRPDEKVVAEQARVLEIAAIKHRFKEKEKPPEIADRQRLVSATFSAQAAIEMGYGSRAESPQKKMANALIAMKGLSQKQLDVMSRFLSVGERLLHGLTHA